MPVAVACPACASRLQVPEKAIGQAVRCPKCKKSFKINAPAGKKASPAPSAGSPAAAQAPQARQKPTAPPVKKAPPKEEVLGEGELDIVEEAIAPHPTPARSQARGSKKPAEEVLDDSHLDMVSEEEDVLDPDDLDMVDDDDVEAMIIPPGQDPFDGLEIDEEDIEAIEKELTRNERIIWLGYPSPEVQDENNLMLIPFLGIFILVGLGMMGVGLFAGMDLLPGIALAVVGFIFAGAGVAAAYFVFKPRPKTNKPWTWYVLTSRRAICWDGAPRNDMVHSFNTLQLDDMKRKDSRKFPGAGSLIFGTVSETAHVGRDVREMERDVGFLHMKDIRKVEHLIRHALIDRRIDRLLE